MKEEKQEITKKKKRKVFRKVLLVLILALLVAGGVLGYRVYQNGGGLKGFLATAVGHDSNTVKNLPKVYCLLLGQSEYLTDTIMIAEYDPQEQQASILSIPRDTFIGENKYTATASHKINTIYQTGAENALKEVNELTGLDIKYYLKVDTEAFRALVDAIGGVTFDVPIDMKYYSGSQHLNIDLKAGVQLLDGDKAEQLVRFRHNNDGTTYPAEYGMEDMGRMRTQRAFLMALAKQTLKVENIFKINQFIDIANKYVETNIDFDTVKDYVPYVVEFNADNLKTEHLPGESEKLNGIWFYLADEEETKTMIDDLFLHPKLNESDRIGESTVDTSGIDKTKVKVEVLNGTSSSYNFDKSVARLENAGYMIEKVGKTTQTSMTTIITRGNVEDVLKEDIKQIIGTENITSGEESTINITIIIGEDYEG